MDIENNQFFSSVYRQNIEVLVTLLVSHSLVVYDPISLFLKPFGRKLESWAVASSKHSLGNYHPLSSLNFEFFFLSLLPLAESTFNNKKLCSCSHFPRTNENESESNDFELYRGINLG